MAYITPSDLDTYINTLTGGTPAAYSGAETALLQTLCDEAQAEIDRVTLRTFEGYTATRYFLSSGLQYNQRAELQYTVSDVTSTRVVQLDEDLLSVSSITNGDSNNTVVNSGDYWLLPMNRTPYYAVQLKPNATSIGAWESAGGNRIVITGTWGFSPTAPADIKRLAKRLAYFYFQKRAQTGEKQTFGGTLVQDASEYPADIKHALARFTRKVWLGSST